MYCILRLIDLGQLNSKTIVLSWMISNLGSLLYKSDSLLYICIQFALMLIQPV
ncbi:hypothetical protein RchiOBHm_Chr1g0344861 [Rosa chinensis]|uniref:Uncharacterized protein n=1 Tax=Rosa chinensis TaxID=74649 RepID=A0A2P6SEL4_ROSCH|nr:hypothetical protein RchiOBHm_Chr1g0344861 [Rosa chinensis]